MKIQVLGSGCANCKKLFELTNEAVKQLDLKEEVKYITDVSKIIEMGVMSSPVLAINGKAVMVGVVPDVEKLKKLLSAGDSVQEHRCKDCDCKTEKDVSCHCGGNC